MCLYGYYVIGFWYWLDNFEIKVGIVNFECVNFLKKN